MPRRIRSPSLETRSQRLRLQVRRKPHAAVAVAPGVSLAYRRGRSKTAWVVLVADGRGGRWTKNLPGVPDDFESADGEHVLDFWQAQVRARELVRGNRSSKPITVEQALHEYTADLVARGGLVAHVQRVRRLLTPSLLQRPVGLLTTRELRRWRDAWLADGLAPATVTRDCKSFAACLNYAANHDPTIGNRSAWKLGLAALPDSHVARTDAVLRDDKIRAVVAACYAESDRLGLLAEVLAVTGCRPVQAARLLVGDLQTDRLLMPRSAKGKGKKRIERRPIPVPPSLVAKLRAAAGDRLADAPLLQRPDGQRWQSVDYGRPFERALAAAGLAKVVPYSLRHSSITRALLRGVPVRVVADTHDTSVAIIERNYANCIADHSDTLVRAAQIDLTPEISEKVVPLPARRS